MLRGRLADKTAIKHKPLILLLFAFLWGGGLGLFLSPSKAQASLTSACASLLPFLHHHESPASELLDLHLDPKDYGRIPSVPLAGTQLPKRPDFTTQLDEVFKDLFRDENIYVKNNCHGNVLRLFKEFDRRLPELRYEDFKVLIIAPPLLGQFTQDQIGLTVRHNRGWAEENGPWSSKDDFWRYHAVLVYRDRVYDLDYGDIASPIYMEGYLNDRGFIQPTSKLVADGGTFYLQNKQDLKLYFVEGGRFFWQSEAQVTSGDFFKVLREKITPVLLSDYVKFSGERN